MEPMSEASPNSKRVDLILLLKEFDAWEEHVSRSTSDQNLLKGELELMKKNLENAKETETYLQKEVSRLMETVDVLQTTLLRRCDLEDENTKLLNSIEGMKEANSIEQKAHLTKVRGMEQEQLNMKHQHEADLDDIKHDLEFKAHEMEVALKNDLEVKIHQLNEKEEQLMQLKNSKESELMKLRMEYDAKLLKQQKQNAKVQQTTSMLSTPNQDIFRKKLQYVKTESEKEIGNLKRKVTELEAKLSAKASHHPTTPVSSLSKRKRY